MAECFLFCPSGGTTLFEIQQFCLECKLCCLISICLHIRDAVSNSDCIEANDWMVANSEMETMLREEVMT